VEAGALTEVSVWLAFGASLGIGLLIGSERERNPAAKAGVRTFALIALFGTLAAVIAGRTENAWTVPLGLAAVAGMLIAAHAREERLEDPGTTTVVAAAVCYLLGVLAGMGEAALAGALAIGVTALLYFKPELEAVSVALKRQDQVSVLQFLVVTFIVLPILPDRGYGPYEALNPRHIWLVVVLISGVGLASYVALRVAGERHGVLLTGALGGLVSSTATTVLYARRSAESEELARVSLVVVLLANLVTLLRVGAIAAVIAPAAIGALAPVLGAALACGLAATLFPMRRLERNGPLPMPEIRNPAELGTALTFATVYAAVLLASAWLSNLAGDRGLYLVALTTGVLDVDAPTLSALNLFNGGRAAAGAAATAVALAFLANTLFKLGVMFWLGGPRFARRALVPFAAGAAGGAAALALV
jgi:uncharacterized membrane protein (DUF4010 family)